MTTDWEFLIAFGTVASVVVAIISAQWRLSSWLTTKFSEIKDLVYNVKDELLKKLEYHEQHDDTRFGQMDKSLNEIRLNMAVQTAVTAVLDHGRKEKRTVRRSSRTQASS